jgi:predicted P-loop ATPase
MKKVTIITGKQGTGKTILAKKLCENKKSIWFDSLENNFEKQIDIDTESIVIDGLSCSSMPAVKKLITAKTLVFRPSYSKNAIKMERPEVILISNSLTKKDFRKREHIEFIEI